MDSSVAAALLVRQGYDVQGVTLQVWEHEDETVAVSKRWEERGCCKVGIARYVAQTLKIPHEVIDTRETFRAGVIDDFVDRLSRRHNPNPCVRCNERVKLRSLMDLADERGIDFVATGHYVRIDRIRGNTDSSASSRSEERSKLFPLPSSSIMASSAALSSGGHAKVGSMEWKQRPWAFPRMN